MRRLVLACVILVVICGCSSFKSSQHMDLTPFAEHTISLIADVNYGMDAHMLVYLREYVDGPPLLEYWQYWSQFRPVLRGIAAYSIAIVTISKSNLTEKERTAQLATFLDKLLRPVVTRPNSVFLYSSAELDTILINVRAQESFFDGLNAAQPLVDEIARFSGEFLHLLKDKQDQGKRWLDRQVREDHAAVLKYHGLLAESQVHAFEMLFLVRNYRKGADPDGLRKLVEEDPILAELVTNMSKVTAKELDSIQKQLLYRLEEIRKALDQLEPDLELFRNQILELDRVTRAATNNLVKANITIIIWSRAHQRLAAGVTDPATVDLMGIAKNALDAALPY